MTDKTAIGAFALGAVFAASLARLLRGVVGTRGGVGTVDIGWTWRAGGGRRNVAITIPLSLESLAGLATFGVALDPLEFFLERLLLVVVLLGVASWRKGVHAVIN